MKFPFTGLYHFCKELGTALKKQLPQHYNLGFYVPKPEEGVFGPKSKYFVQSSLHKLLKFQLPACDIWHCTYQGSDYLPMRNAKTKIVATVHDLNFLHQGKSLLKQKAYLLKTQRLIDRADKIVAISNFVKEEIETNLNTKGKEVTVIYNGRNKPPGIVFRKPPGNFDRPFFFSVGTITAKKNFHVLPALLLKNDHDLIIAGITQNETYKKKIIDEAERLGVGDRVRLLGAVPETEKYWLMQHCAAFAFPSLAEGFGLPVIEAMQMGTPVLLSRHTSLPEIGGPHALFFDDLTEAGISSLAQKFLTSNVSQQKRNELIAWAEQFDWEKSAKAYADIYNSLLT